MSLTAISDLGDYWLRQARFSTQNSGAFFRLVYRKAGS